MSETYMRRAAPADAERMNELCKQLGYDTSVEALRERIENAIRQGDMAAFVAEEDSVVIGWIQVAIRSTIESGELAEITGLVVDESLRGRGIGAGLVREAELWAKEKGFSSIRVRTNVIRNRTHDFYRKLGFSETKRQVVFRKEM